MQAQDNMDEPLIIRKNLFGNGRGKVLIDIPAVYRKIDAGKKLEEICLELGVSRTTLYRRHKDYQKMVEAFLAGKQLPE